MRRVAKTFLLGGLCPDCRNIDAAHSEVYKATECNHPCPDKPEEGMMWKFCRNCSHEENCCRGCGADGGGVKAPDLCDACLKRPVILAETARECGHLTTDHPVNTAIKRCLCTNCGLDQGRCRGCGVKVRSDKIDESTAYIPQPSASRNLPWAKRLERGREKCEKKRKEDITKILTHLQHEHVGKERK